MVKFSKAPQKTLIENRVKSDLKRLRQFFQSEKLEKFDREEAKNRLTIISKLTMEKINSKENRPFQDTIKENKALINQKPKTSESKEIKQKSVSNQITENIQMPELKLKSNEKQKSVIINEKNPIEYKESTQIESMVTKPAKFELTREITVEEAIKKLRLASRTATVVIEIKENKEESPSKLRENSIIFSPIPDNSKPRKSEQTIRFSSEEKNEKDTNRKTIKPTSPNKAPVSRLLTNQIEIEDSKKSKQSSDQMLDLANKKTVLNQNLSKTYRDHQSKLIQERLKDDAEFRKTRHSSPERRKNKKAFKYDDDENEAEAEGEETVEKVTRIEFE